MARGITESDVHTAADEIVAAGERPTVERIRAHLGTGSPNTVTRLLETWWQKLGVRLQAQHRRIGVPDAPEAVMVLAGEWWAIALEHARTTAAEALALERSAFQGDQDTLRREREEFAAESAALRDKVEVATHAERLASTQAAELQRLASQLESQAEEMAKHLDAASKRAAEADTARRAADVRIQELQDVASVERERSTQHVRAVEDRAHAEIDRAREETRELQTRLTTVAKAHAAIEKSLRDTTDQAKAAANDAVRVAGIERARADALEKQLAKLQDLPAALEAALRQTRAGPKERKPGSEQTVRVSGKRTKASVGN